MTKEWDESEVTWNNADEDTEWEMLDPDTKFYNLDLEDTVSSPGGGDYNPEYITVVEYAEMNTWENYDVTEVIKEAIEKPESFYGVMIKQFLERRENERKKIKKRSNQGRAYYSSENDELDKRPKLTVKYTSSGINNLLLSKSKDNIHFLRIGEKITVFVNYKKTYDVLVINIQGKKLISLTSSNKSWIDIPVNYLSSGINIVTIKIGQRNISKKFTFVK